MVVKGTYFQNDAEKPLVYGEVEIQNIPRRRLRGEEEKEGKILDTECAYLHLFAFCYSIIREKENLSQCQFCCKSSPF